ncbi:fumarylacetoacetate hydrolase family protein [Sphingobacterium daejeonense]|uniref:fumarylacetoacetate hydrolase family protein n=1 Tax=Sphingobacterium daejeonense TaxID=371142 RepID=UPI0021A8350A|nr:fumarylacetoacetate hydrolase family protein [Sphingobacterium daejeonense]MCT1531932.1 fumarylacetoacetate hydrolase family protein [Sphingobacterium daejeonense]
MKLVTYRANTEAEGRLGVIISELDVIVDIEQLGITFGIDLPKTMLEFIDLGPIGVKAVNKIIKSSAITDFVTCSVPIDNAILLAPIPRPRKNIFGIGLNYTEHVAESARTLDTSKELPQKCVIFSKPPTTVIANGDPIKHNENVTKQMDWEGELGVIIGKKATKVSKEKALDYVFGYTIINDISARDCRRSGQWIVSKGQDTYAPMGPIIITADELTDPHNLDIITKVNGVEKQNGNTKYMLFNVNDIIEDISEVITLEPGDIIATGTPAGVGAGRDPQEFMWPGDVVEITIEPIGTLRNPIVKA